MSVNLQLNDAAAAAIICVAMVVLMVALVWADRNRP